MTTLGDLLSSVHMSLHSYTGLHEQTTWLTGSILSTDTTITVAGAEEVLRGVAEIEDELIYVHTTTGADLTLAPFGRGYRGTTAAAHAANTPVTFDPAFPKAEIRRSISQAVEALYPTLYRVTATNVTVEENTVGHDLPADCEHVIRVEANYPADPTIDNWVQYARWDFDPNSPVGTGKILNIYQGLPLGTILRVTYAGKFGTFANDAATFASVGMPESYADLLTYSVTSRMVRFLDPSRLTLGTVENISRAQVVQAGDAGKLANQLYAMYQTRLAEERRRLLDLYPAQSNFLPR
jgi:hypothetical protein